MSSRLPLLDLPVACPACASTANRAFHVYRNREEHSPYPWLALIGCEGCGLCFTYPRPTAEEAATYYEDEEHNGWSRGKSLEDPRGLEKADRRFEVKREAARIKWAHLRSHLALAPRPAGRPLAALDFGCGGGAFLDALKEDGWQTAGVEPHRMRLLAGLRHAMLTDLPTEPTYDLVILSHVLEHLVEPAGLLRRLAATLHVGGHLFIAVPDVDGLGDHGDITYIAGIVHMNSFTQAALANLARMAGCEPVRSFPGSEWHAVNEPDAKRHAQLSRKVGDAPLPLRPDALANAADTLRRCAARLNASGKFERAAG
jgi:SAM-dependent methyltransferase